MCSGIARHRCIDFVASVADGREGDTNGRHDYRGEPKAVRNRVVAKAGEFSIIYTGS